MQFQIGDILEIQGESYSVTGIVRYKNLSDGCKWEEYCLQKQYGGEFWLSCDDTFMEYSISSSAYRSDTSGYHQVDTGTEYVEYACGKVDVERGDTARFIEYEDEAEENILSIETWDDEVEYSTGYYLDADEIVQTGFSDQIASMYASMEHGSSSNMNGGGSTATIKGLVVCISLVWLFILFASFFEPLLSNLSSRKSISKYLKNDANYQYVTSITGSDKQKADVYASNFDLDQTAKAIIREIGGQAEDATQNTDDGDNSVGILTKSEYCLVYQADDGQVLVQVSSRKYAYTSDEEPYRAGAHSRRYYRRYYYSRGYAADQSRYSKKHSAYSGYTDTWLDADGNGTYNSYAGSIRQASANARTSSGGGLSSGK